MHILIISFGKEGYFGRYFLLENKTRAKFIIAILLFVVVTTGLYLRWSPVVLSSDPLERWGRGNMTIVERTYYISRIERIIDNWRQSHGRADFDKDGRFKESYRTLLVIDSDKQAIWIEEDGQIQKNNYEEFPAGMKWKLYQSTPRANRELSSRLVFKIRGFNSSQQTPERFVLVGTGRGFGYMSFQFNSNSSGRSYNSGTFSLQPYSSSRKITNSYGSILVTDAEYEQCRTDTIPKQPDGENTIIPASSPFEENKANWLKSEKFIYSEIEKQLSYAGFELSRLKLEPGPDYSAGHAEIRGDNHSLMRSILGRSSSVEAYLKIDYLGNDIWYVKSAVNHRHPIMSRQRLDLEFLACSQDKIPNSMEQEFLEKGRQKQLSFSVPETKWKAALPNGATVEFIGICENPSAGRQWWGPDGSLLDYVPYINTEAYSRPHADRKIYEFAWRIKMPTGSNATTHSLEGSMGSYYRQISDRYGNRIIEGLFAEGYGFNKSRQKTTLKIGIAAKGWKKVLSIEDVAGETKFLGKQRILLNPPVIEDGQIVIRCHEEYRSHVRDYQTDFGIIVRKGALIKTDSLNQYEEDITDNKDTGLREYKFTIEELEMYQIEGVCFRYRPYEFVKFKNITLIPGKDQKFEIELGKQ